MIDLPFLLDQCEDCGSKWRTSDRDASHRCLVCGSARLRFARPGLLAAAGVAVVAIAGMIVAMRPSEHRIVPGAAPKPDASTPSYVAPIATSRDQAMPGATVRPANQGGSGDALVPVQGGNARINSSESAEVGATADQFPSLDCSSTSSDVAHKVCASPALTKMDEELSIVYSLAAQGSGKKQALAAEQDQWQRNVLGACGDEHCMTAAYRERTEQLAGGLGEP